VNDAYSSGNPFLVVNRTGIGLDSVELQATTIFFTGNSVVTGTAYLTGNTEVHGHLRIEGADKIFRIKETDAAADEKVWGMWSLGGQLRFFAQNDAESGENVWMSVTRTGATPNVLALAATSITLNGVAASDYARLSVANTFTNAVQTISAAEAQLNALSGSVNTRLWASTADSSGYVGTTTAHQFGVLTGGAVRFAADSSGNFNFFGGLVTTSNANPAEVGFKGVPTASDETPVLTDAGKIVLASANVTIPANGSVAFPVGTVLTFVAVGAARTIAITTDTMTLAGTATTGTRTLAQNGLATAVKTAATTWIISGAGLS
jgi:hypothetical protein